MTVGMPVPTVTLVALESGSPVVAKWAVDRGEIGVIDANGVFTPSGTTAGTATIAASAEGYNATATILVKIAQSQNGGSASELAVDAGAGGYGGVGGSGLARASRRLRR